MEPATINAILRFIIIILQTFLLIAMIWIGFIFSTFLYAKAKGWGPELTPNQIWDRIEWNKKLKEKKINENILPKH